MNIFYKVLDLYQNDLISILQINALTALFVILLLEYINSRKNPLSRQVLERMKKSRSKNKKSSLNFEEVLNFFRSSLSKVEKKAKLRLDRAHLNFTPAEYVTFYMIGTFAGVLIGLIIFPFAGIFKSALFIIDNPFMQSFLGRILAAIIFGLIGSLTPLVWTKHLISKRQKELYDQLLDFLMSLADGVKSSPTVQEALSTVANEIQEPLSTELKIAVKELQFAVPFAEAMQSLSDRINVKEYTLAINAIQIQSQTGGELEKLLRNMAKVFQERKELFAEIQKIIRGPKTTSYILLASPFAALFLFSFASEDFFSSLFSSAIGWGCIIAAIILYIIAFFLLTRINKYINKVT